MQEMFTPLLDDLDDDGYDFISLDSDQNGDFDHVVVVHSGYPAELGNPNDGCTGDANNRIWSQGFTSSSGWLSSDFSSSVSNYVLVGAFTEGFCDGNPVEMGVVVHEYMHGFGLLDLYDEDYEEETILIGGAGKFGLMSNSYGW